MKALLRTLLLWFLLAAVPFGGFASATMLLCAPDAAPAAPAAHHAMDAGGQHDHAAMLAARHADASAGHAGGHHATGEHDGGTSHASHGKCASTGACCIGAPLTPAPPAALPLQDGRCATVPFVPAAPAAVDLAGLERPPKTSLA